MHGLIADRILTDRAQRSVGVHTLVDSGGRQEYATINDNGDCGISNEDFSVTVFRRWAISC
jgi:hypothetical protein